MGFLSLGISGRNLGLLTIPMHFIDKNPSSQRIEKQANEPSLIVGKN